MKQQYKNHSKYYYPHHFIFYPVVTTLIICSAVQALKYPDRSLEWMAITAIFILLAWLSFMMRQHYSLTAQNRIVRMEMRLRYYQLTQKSLGPIETSLSFPQLAALRFAPDDELLALIQETLDNNLSPDVIKRSIKNWLPDTMRV
ncbi:MAG: hypothetical protein H7Z13_00160 [Ferruginibacter sp.]|nr:hypothetical protein [Ferruginibacter sp.]